MRIVCKDLTYVYNKNTTFSHPAVKNVSLTIEEGEFFGIIGHTGSGKSTFVQHLNGLIPLDGGSLYVGETDLRLYDKKQYKSLRAEGGKIYSPNGKKLTYRRYRAEYFKQLKVLRSQVGMVFQYPEYQLFGDTVFDDVAFGLKNFHPEYTAAQVEEAVRDAITRVGLDYGEVRNKSPFDLSGGQKRRVAIAGVIVTHPQVLILDEPVAGLDPQGKRELMALLHDLHGGLCKTVVIVSHDMDDVAENCTGVAVFSEGELVSVGTPRQLFARGEDMTKIGLDTPITAKLTEALSGAGVEIDSNYTIESFTSAVTQKWLKTHKN